MRLRLLGGLVALVLVMVGASYAINHSLRARRDITPSSHQNIASSAGAISGRVVDADGQLVFKAEVHALNTESGMGKVPTGCTDDQGVFLIKNLNPGTYKVSVSKEEDGYPPTEHPFHSVGFVEAPQVTVYEGQTTADVVARLGPKSAKLVGRVVDAINHRPVPIEDVRITLRRVDDPDNSYTSVPNVEGKVDILVPPVPIMIEISAPGYETKRVDSLRLRSEETRRLDFTLRPVRGVRK